MSPQALDNVTKPLRQAEMWRHATAPV